MTFESFMKNNRNVMIAYFLLNKLFPGKFEIDVPHPPSELSEEAPLFFFSTSSARLKSSRV